MQPETWAQFYLGLPWVAFGRDLGGVDCWGLVGLVLRREEGIRVDDWLVDPANPAKVAAAVAEGSAASTWAHVVWDRDRHRDDQLRAARAFDVVLMAPPLPGHAPHIGIVCGRLALLHCEIETGVTITPLTERRILNRIRTIHRHETLI